MSESAAEQTPGPIRAARAAVAEYDSRRGVSRPETPFKIDDKFTQRRLIFDLPIAVHVVVWITVGSAIATGTTWVNGWMGARIRHEADTDSAIAAIIKRQDAIDTALRESAAATRDLTVQISRLGGIIDSRNKINSTLRGSGGGIGE